MSSPDFLTVDAFGRPPGGRIRWRRNLKRLIDERHRRAAWRDGQLANNGTHALVPGARARRVVRWSPPGSRRRRPRPPSPARCVTPSTGPAGSASTARSSGCGSTPSPSRDHWHGERRAHSLRSCSGHATLRSTTLMATLPFAAARRSSYAARRHRWEHQVGGRPRDPEGSRSPRHGREPPVTVGSGAGWSAHVIHRQDSVRTKGQTTASWWAGETRSRHATVSRHTPSCGRNRAGPAPREQRTCSLMIWPGRSSNPRGGPALTNRPGASPRAK